MAELRHNRLQRAAAFDPLGELLVVPEKYNWLIGECRALVETQLKNKGIALRTAMRLAERAKPGLTEHTLRELLPGFVRELEPFYAAWRARGVAGFADYLVARDRQVADALLVVTDRRMAPVQNRSVRAGYQRLRGRAEQEVIAAVPAIANILAQHVDARQRATLPARSAQREATEAEAGSAGALPG